MGQKITNKTPLGLVGLDWFNFWTSPQPYSMTCINQVEHDAALKNLLGYHSNPDICSTYCMCPKRTLNQVTTLIITLFLSLLSSVYLPGPSVNSQP